MFSNQSIHVDLSSKSFNEECENESMEIIDPETTVTNRIYDSLFKKAFNLSKKNEVFLVEFISGNLYNGSLSKNKLFGQGTYSWTSDGVIYSGCFERNQMQNYGRMKYPGEITYCGDIKDSQWSGYGKLNIKNFIFEGHFRRGLTVGAASISALPKSFKGIMNNNKPKYGVRKYANGIFKGVFDDFGYRFKGKFMFHNNDSYEGTWHSDKFCDFGIYVWRDRKAKSNSAVFLGNYIGYWLNGMRHGIGKMEFQDRLICCTWEKDKKQGPGVVMSANGAIFAYKNMFSKNNFICGKRISRCKGACDLIDEMLELCEVDYPCYDSEIIPCLIESDCSFENSFKYENCECQTLDDFSKDIESRDYSRQTQTYNCSQNNLLPRSEMFINKIDQLIDRFAETIETTRNALFIPKYEVDNLILRPWLFQIIRQQFFDYSINAIYETELSFVNQMLEDNYDLCKDLYDIYATLSKSSLKVCHSSMNRLGLWIFYENVFKGTKYNICEVLIEADNWFGTTGNNKKHWSPFSKVHFWEFMVHILYIVSIINVNPFIFNHSVKVAPKFYGWFATMVLIFLRQHQFLEPVMDKTMSSLFKTHFNYVEDLFSKIKTEVHPSTLKNVFEFVKEHLMIDNLYSKHAEVVGAKFNQYLTANENDFKITPLQFFDLILKFIETQLLNDIEK